MKKLVILLLLFCSSIAFSQETIYLEGNLAKNKIYMKIRVHRYSANTDLNAVYFYQNSLKDIKLEARLKNNTYIFFFKPDEKIAEKFYLKRMRNNHFEGAWYNAAGKQFQVQLQPINFSNYKYDLNQNYTYEKLNFVKCKFLEFKKQKTTTYNNKEFIWYSEKHSDAIFFRLGNNFSKKNKTVINSILEKIHLENALAQLNCSAHFSYNKGKGIGENSTINFLNNNLLGFQISKYWDCAGALPDFGRNGYLIDLNNGKEFELDDVISFNESVTTEKQSDFSSFSAYRQTFFAPKLFSIINSAENFIKPPKNDQDNNSDDICDYTNEKYWYFPSWSYTEKGIKFTPNFYKATRSCERSFLAPFEKLRKYKNPKFPYSF